MKQLNLIASTICNILSESNLKIDLYPNYMEFMMFGGKFKTDGKSFSFDDGEYYNESEIDDIYDIYNYIALKEMLFNGFKKHENSLIPFSRLYVRDKQTLIRMSKKKNIVLSKEEIYRDVIFYSGSSRVISLLLDVPLTVVKNLRKYNREALIQDAIKKSLLSCSLLYS